ncbi:MAG: sigma-54-dependent Fis family transcriptional regulator, partial [Fibrobacteres bacterium]|nr:sigma-54-dependent Fis family transcriptional regulator [Fibrobacterota bacterium]
TFKRDKLSEGDLLNICGVNLKFTFFPPISIEQHDSGSIDIMESLYKFSSQLLNDPDKEPVARLLDALVEAIGAEKGFLAVRDDENFVISAMRNMDASSIDEADGVSKSLVKRALESKKPMLFSDAPADTSLGVSQSLMGLKFRSILVVPILKEGVVRAVLYAGSSKAASLFDEDDLKAATVFAAQASLLLENAEKLAALDKENRALRQLSGTALLYKCEKMETLVRQAVKLAASSMPVLVRGETGTGKELLAQLVHARSGRAEKPFITVNCAAIPESLVESELFGHKKGAFTGAVSDTVGKIGIAEGGTLFLDEIGELPINQQAKLLRVLESGEYERVGEPNSRKADVRIVAATNRDLSKDGFRQDLYYRLSAAELLLPPLRERDLDIVLIAHAFLAAAPENSKRKLRFSKEAESAILKHGWPGNVRELKHRVMRAAVLAEKSEITPEDLELGAGEDSAILPLSEAKERFAKDYIMRILLLNNGNKSAAARDLGIDPRTIYRYAEEDGDK